MYTYARVSPAATRCLIQFFGSPLASRRPLVIAPGTIFAAFCLEIRVSARVSLALSPVAPSASVLRARLTFLSSLAQCLVRLRSFCCSSLVGSSRVHCQFVICLDQARIGVQHVERCDLRLDLCAQSLPPLASTARCLSTSSPLAYFPHLPG